MAQWIVIAEEADVPPGTMTDATAGGLSLLVANAGGQYHVTQGECTHRGGPLPEGSLSGTTVTCPWHGSRFDVTSGAVLSPPATHPLRTFAVRVENGRILVELP